MLTTFYFAKNDHRWVTLSLKKNDHRHCVPRAAACSAVDSLFRRYLAPTLQKLAHEREDDVRLAADFQLNR